MYVLDTDVLIWILREGRGNKVVFDAIKRFILTSPKEMAISTITVAEIYKNVRTSEEKSVEATINEYKLIPVTGEIAKEAGLYWQKFHPKLLSLSLSDCLVAATAKNENSSLVTLNTKHFPMQDIKIQNPLKS